MKTAAITLIQGQIGKWINEGISLINKDIHLPEAKTEELKGCINTVLSKYYEDPEEQRHGVKEKKRQGMEHKKGSLPRPAPVIIALAQTRSP